MNALENRLESGYEGVVHSVFELAREQVRITPHFDRFFKNNVPGYIQQFYSAERRYVHSLCSEIDQQLDQLVQEKEMDFAERPQECLDKPIRSLLQFSDPERQRQFVNNVYQTIEDVTYALEVAAFEAYRIYDVKVNTPIVGYFARSTLKRKLGMEDLPEFEETLAYIQKSKKYTLEQISKTLGCPIQEDPHYRSQTEAKYNTLMNRHKQGVALDYSNRHLSSSSSIQRSGLERDLHYSMNRYNNIFEKAIGVIGSIFNYFWSLF